MTSDSQLSQIESENGLLFGLKWSMVGVILALCLLAGCSSWFSSDPPRYNTVVGERRMPVLNPGSGQPVGAEAYAQPEAAMSPSAPPQAYPQAGQAAYAPASAAPVESGPVPMPQAQRPAYAPQAAQQSPSNSEIEAEIAAMERELASSQQQQRALQAQTAPPQPQQQDNGWLPSLGMDGWFSSDEQYPELQPLPQQSSQPGMTPPQNMAYAPAVAPQQNNAGLLPPPPVGSNYGNAAAPVIDDAAVAAHHQASPSVEYNAPVAAQDVPLAPGIQGAAAPPVPSGLIPPELAGEYGAGYLPPSRYKGRY